MGRAAVAKAHGKCQVRVRRPCGEKITNDLAAKEGDVPDTYTSFSFEDLGRDWLASDRVCWRYMAYSRS